MENTPEKEQGGSNASLDAYTLRDVGVSTATSRECLKNDVCAQFSQDRKLCENGLCFTAILQNCSEKVII